MNKNELALEAVALGIDLGPYFQDWVDGNYADAALGPFASFSALFVAMVGFMIVAGIGIYSRSIRLPAIVGALYLGFASGFVPGLVARLGFLTFVGVAAAVLYMAIRVFGR